MRILAALVLFPVILFGATESVSVDTKTKKVQNPVVKFGSGNTLDCTGATVTNCGSGSGVAWGAITGTLSNQTDLQSALNAKGTGTVTSIATTSPITGGTITGTGTLGLDVGVDHQFTVEQSIILNDSGTPDGALVLGHNNNAGPGTESLSVEIKFQLEDSTTDNIPVSYIQAAWDDATDAHPVSHLDIWTTNLIATDKFRFQGKGALSIGHLTDPGVPGIDARLIPQGHAVTSATSWTPASDAYDQEAQTALAGDVTINAPSGTPSDGKKLILRIKCNGSGHNITWNGAYIAMGVTLPTTISASKTIYAGCDYNSNTSKWDVLAVAIEP